MNKPKLSENVDVGSDKEGQLHFIFVNSRRHLTVKASPITVKLVAKMDGTKSIAQIANEAGATAGQVDALCMKMQESGLLVEAESEQNESRTCEDFSSFDRQISFFQDFSEMPTAMQQRIADSSVALFGDGAIGGQIAYLLARSGVGAIRVVDPEEVSISNIARHAFFTLEDIGLSKVQATEKHLRSVAGSLTFKGVRASISCEADVLSRIEGVDLVINAADTPSVAATSEWVGRACMQKGIPHILAGGYRTHLGFLGPTILPNQTACWKCFATDYQKNDPFARTGWMALEISRPNGGGIGALSAIVAAVHAWEAIRILSGALPPVMINKKAEFDFINLSLSWREIERDPNCSECGAGRQGNDHINTQS